MGSASVMCSGRCEGEVTPPSASVECEASAKAEASVEVECTPPSIDVSYQFSASADAQVKAEFQAFLIGFRANMSAILAELKRAEVVIAAAGELTGTGVAAVRGSVEAAVDGDVSLKVATGLTCALGELDDVATVVNGSTGRLNAQVSDAADVSGALAGG
jgi:hypothetical protein